MRGTKTYYSDEIKAVVWEINGFVSTEMFKEIGSESHNLRNKHSVKKQLNNIKDMKILTPEIQKWIEEVWFPAAQKTGLEYFAFIVPTNAFGKITMENVNSNAKEKFNIEIKYYDEEIDAKKWLISK